MSRRRPVAAMAVAVILAALATATAPPPVADAAPALEELPPYFAPSPTSGDYTITVNGVELVSDATGFNHWGGEMALYAARTGLLVEADRVRIRVERPVAAGAFSVGLQIFACDDSGCSSVDVEADLEAYDVASECDAGSTAVVVPVLSDGTARYDYLNNRRAFLVGDSAAVGSVHRFDCSLTMAPGGSILPIATIFLEVGAKATFRAEAAQFITGRIFDGGLDTEAPIADGTYDTVLTAAGCTYETPSEDGTAEAALAAAIFDGGTAAELAPVLDCPDGRIDLYDDANEAHVLPAFANPRSLAADLAAWRAGDASAGDYDPFLTSGSTLRVPTCVASSDVMPCLESIDDGWGMNLTDFTRSSESPSMEMTLIRTAADATVGYGTVAQEGPGDRVSFALRVPTGTVRGVPWANMARPAGYLFAQVAAYEVDRDPSDHVVVSATLEPRARSSALDATTFGFQCTVTVGGGASTATDCDIPSGALSVDRLRMQPRAWISASAGGTYRATKKVLGWRVDTIPGSCDSDPSDDFDTSDDCYDVPDPDGTPTVTQAQDMLYTSCGGTVYVDAGTDLLVDGKLAAIASEDPDCDPFVESSSPVCSAEQDGDFCPVSTRVVHLEVRDADGARVADPSTGRPVTTVALTDSSGAFQLFSDADATTPLELNIGSTLAYEGCESMCYEVEAPAIRAKVVSDADQDLAVYDASGAWTHTLVQSVTPACVAAVEPATGCQQGRKVDWLSATDGSDDRIIPLGDSIVSILTETPHDFSAGDDLLLGGVESTQLDGTTGFTVLDVSITGVSFTASSGVVAALTSLGNDAENPNDCALDGSGFLEESNTCGPDVVDFDTNPSRMILRTTTDHGFGAAGTTLTGDSRVTTTLLGNEFDGTFEAVVVDADEIAIDGAWFATDAYEQSRDGVMVQGTSSKVVITETTLTMFLDGLPEADASIAGGFVATNGQTFTFGEDMRTGRAFDFALAGPSRDADGRSRGSDGFFQAFIPAAFLDESFELTVAGAVNALEVNRRNAGSVGSVEFTGNPAAVTGDLASGLLISSDGFSYSAPYFAAERRTTPAPEPEGGTRGPVTLPNGTVPTVPQGARTATVGGRTVVPTVPAATGDRMQLVVEGSSVVLGGPGGLGGLATREVGGERLVELQQGSSFPLSGEGFQPGSVVEVWLFSDPQLLALARVAADGTLTGEVPLDGWSSGGPIPPGRHTLQVSGVAADGQVLALSLGVEVVTELTRVRASSGTGSGAGSDATDADGDAAAPAPAGDASSDTGDADADEVPAEESTPGTAAPDASVEVVTAAEDADGGGALRTLGLLAAVLLVAMGAYATITARRRRASS